MKKRTLKINIYVIIITFTFTLFGACCNHKIKEEKSKQYPIIQGIPASVR